jgi:large subunit ribosomal protein L6
MSRVGKKLINLPSGVTVSKEEDMLSIKGKLGEDSVRIHPLISVDHKDNHLLVSPKDESKEARALWGTFRSLINNMVTGVSTGFTRRLEIVGVGYRASLQKNILTVSIGYSHDIKIRIPEGITVKCEKPTLVEVFGISKQLVGQFCAKILTLRKLDPYKGKGIMYEGAKILRKENKKK